MREAAFLDVFTDVTRGNAKLQTSGYFPTGRFPIIDQGRGDIAGYSDDESLLARVELPVLVFGDHTRIVKYVDRPFIVGADGTKVLRPSASCDARYLFHYLRSIKIPNAGYSRHYKFLKEVSVPLPDLDEQRRISAILDRADDLRIRSRQMLVSCESLVDSVFRNMFTASGMERESIGNLVNWKNGRFLPSSKMISTGDYSVYGGNGVNGKHDEYMFAEPKLVLGRVGAYCGVVHVTEPNSWITDNALYADTISDSVTLDYLAAALRDANLNQYSSQSGQPLISGSRIKNVEIALPSVEHQKAFSDRVSSIDRITCTVKARLVRLDALFASLQHLAFSGAL